MKFDKTYIDIQMEPLPESSKGQAISARCLGCTRTCTILFDSPDGFRYVFVGKLASVFSSLCKKLDAEAALKERLAGARLLTSAVSKEIEDGTR